MRDRLNSGRKNESTEVAKLFEADVNLGASGNDARGSTPLSLAGEPDRVSYSFYFTHHAYFFAHTYRPGLGASRTSPAGRPRTQARVHPTQNPLRKPAQHTHRPEKKPYTFSARVLCTLFPAHDGERCMALPVLKTDTVALTNRHRLCLRGLARSAGTGDV